MLGRWTVVCVVLLASTLQAGSSLMCDSTGFVWPLSGNSTPDFALYTFSTPFGPRLRSGVAYDWHRGNDITCPVGTPVYAVHDGRVVKAGQSSGYSDPLVQLRITKSFRNPLGLGSAYTYANYLHLSAAAVAVDQDVTQGQLLGYTGESSTGYAHLHFELRDGGSWQQYCIHPLSRLPYDNSAPGPNTRRMSAKVLEADAGSGDVLVEVLSPDVTLDVAGVSLETSLQGAEATPFVTNAGLSVDFAQLTLEKTGIPTDLTVLDNPLVRLASGHDVGISPFSFNGQSEGRLVMGWNITFYKAVGGAGPGGVLAVRAGVVDLCGDVAASDWWLFPTANPTSSNPTSANPTHMPTKRVFTKRPTVQPTIPLTFHPSANPTYVNQTANPTSANPSANPTTMNPTLNPTTVNPSSNPSANPTTANPSTPNPSSQPTENPTANPSTINPTFDPTANPTTANPSGSPTTSPSVNPTTANPSFSSSVPTPSPTPSPSSSPTVQTSDPSMAPTQAPTTDSGSSARAGNDGAVQGGESRGLSSSALVNLLVPGAIMLVGCVAGAFYCFCKRHNKLDTTTERLAEGNAKAVEEQRDSPKALGPGDVEMGAPDKKVVDAGDSLASLSGDIEKEGTESESQSDENVN